MFGNSSFRRLTLILAAIVITLATSAMAKADVYTITNTNFAGNGNFGSITTTLVGNTIQVQIALDPNYVMHGKAFGFNVVGSTTGLTLSGFSSAFFSDAGGGGTMDGFGGFEFQVDGQNTSTARSNNLSNLTFTVSRTAGFTDANQIAELNPNWLFALQIAPIDPQANTGFAASASGPTTTVPEPASMMLLGMGLAGAAASVRRRRKRT